MTMGRVSLKIVADLLRTIEVCLEDLRKLPTDSLEEFTFDFRNSAAAESLLRRAIQALFDLLRHILAKGYGKGTLEYKELARLAADKGLIQDARLAAVLKELGGFRNRLTHVYQDVTSEELYGILKNELGDLEGIARELQRSAIRLSGG